MGKKKCIYIMEIDDIEPLRGWVEIMKIPSTGSYIIKFDEELEDTVVRFLRSRGAKFLTEMNE